MHGFSPHAQLSRWAVGCPNRALPCRNKSPAPGRPAPREGNTDTSIHPIASTSNLVPQPRTWGSLLAHEKSRHHWLLMVSRPPPGRPCLMLQTPLPMGYPSGWAKPLGCGLSKPGVALPQRKSRPWTPRPTGREHRHVNPSYRLNLEPRSATEDLGELAGPREIPSPLASHGEPPAARKALPDGLKRSLPMRRAPTLNGAVGLSRWAVGCPNQALPCSNKSPAPGRPAPREGNTDRSIPSYHLNLEPRSATEDLGEPAGPREIPSPLAFNGEPPAARKALPDVAKRPFPWVTPQAGLSRWAVGCPNQAVPCRNKSPAPGRPAPREGNTDRSIPTYRLNLKPRSATEDLGQLAGPREIPSPLAFNGEPPAARKALPDGLKRSLPMRRAPTLNGAVGLSRWAVGCPNRALPCRNKSPAPWGGRPRHPLPPWMPRRAGMATGHPTPPTATTTQAAGAYTTGVAPRFVGDSLKDGVLGRDGERRARQRDRACPGALTRNSG